MIRENEQKIIIISLAVFLLASFIFLAYTERRQHQLNDGWFLYFENPKDGNLDFTIENYSGDFEFEWKLLTGDNLIKNEKIIVKNKEKKVIEVKENNLSGKVEIEVKLEKDKKEIYKIITAHKK